MIESHLQQLPNCLKFRGLLLDNMQQAIVLRSMESFEALCNALSVLHLLRAGDAENVMRLVADASLTTIRFWLASEQ